MDSDMIERTLRSYGWEDRPATDAAELLSGMCRDHAVTRQQADAVLTDVFDEHAASLADRGQRSRTVSPAETERITAAIG